MITQAPARASHTLVVRKADRHFQCRCARPLLGYRAEILDRAGQLIAASGELLPARASAQGWAQDYLAEHPSPTADIRILPEPNPNYQPECLSMILPGDRYIADTDSDSRYCLRCGTARAAKCRGGPS